MEVENEYYEDEHHVYRSSDMVSNPEPIRNIMHITNQQFREIVDEVNKYNVSDKYLNSMLKSKIEGILSSRVVASGLMFDGIGNGE